MSEPITRASIDAPINRAFMDRIAQVLEREGDPEDKWRIDLAEVITQVCAEFGAYGPESASPPRVPGASARDELAGVESGPGQPIDIVERLNGDADGWESAVEVGDENGLAPLGAQYTATLEREAATEIRRLRTQVDAERDYKAGLARLKEIRAEGFRAGIEAAAHIEDRLAEHWERRPGDSKSTLTYGDLAEGARSRAVAIRALADKPAPDAARKGG